MGKGEIDDSKKEKIIKANREYFELAHLITQSKDLLTKLNIYQKKLFKYIVINLNVSGTFLIDDFSLL
tara:strand:+ start:10236 stop:10439 length:204 start_codon:yes stop_codon:yes gene_type:complete